MGTAATAKSFQSCPTLCDPTDGSPPGSPVPGILQARTLEWVAISSSNAWKWKVKGKSLSHVWLFTTPWTAAYQAPLSMGFSRQEYWSGVPSPSPGVFCIASEFFTNWATKEAPVEEKVINIERKYTKILTSYGMKEWHGKKSSVWISSISVKSVLWWKKLR